MFPSLSLPLSGILFPCAGQGSLGLSSVRSCPPRDRYAAGWFFRRSISSATPAASTAP